MKCCGDETRIGASVSAQWMYALKTRVQVYIYKEHDENGKAAVTTKSL